MACVSGLTNGIYSYVDCCGNLQSGISLGESICIDGAYSGSATGVYVATGQTCTQNCSNGNITYSFSTTGICDTTSGSTIITPFGGVGTYTIDNIIPGTLSAQTGTGPFLYTGLTGGTYVFRLNDSLGIQNNETYLNVYVSQCFTAIISNTTTTTCGENNGSITVSASSIGSPYYLFLYKDDTIQTIQQTQTLPYVFNNLGEGEYYVTVYDYGSVSANTPNTIIYDSNGVNFGLWKVNTSNCVINTGKLAVTGVTGSGPFTYSWSNGETTQLVTGLTVGSYSCTVTDINGCSTTVTETIGQAEPLGLLGLTSVNPSCFASDGSLTYTLSGGTAPYYYSAVTGEVGYTLSNTFTLTNLGSGNYSVIVRDANFCELTLAGSLITQNGFTISNINVTNSNCSQNNGEISVTINGTGSQNYLYVLSAQTGGTVYSYYGNNQTFNQTGLNNATYDLLISGSGSACAYTTTATINSEQKFTISATTTGSTCGQPNGGVSIMVNSGYTGFLTYVLENIDNPFINDSVVPSTTSTAETFTSLVNGNYKISVIDTDGCSVSEDFVITTTNQVNFLINPTNCVGVTPGYASATIFQGEPPFSYSWSNGSTGLTATGLTAGTYSLTVTDDNGCSLTNFFNINCTGELITNYETYSLCSNTFTTTSGNRRGLSEMFFEGFMDVTSGYTGCTINSADLTCEITVNGSAYTQTFANITSIDDIPSDNLWIQSIEYILSTTPVFGEYTIDQLNNTIHIESNCNGDVDDIGNGEYSLGLSIEYDVSCTGSATTTPIITCCSPTIVSAGPIGSGLFGIYFNLNCGPCISTTIQYSTDSGATWSIGNTSSCSTYRTIPTTVTTGDVYFRISKNCGSGVISDYSDEYIYTFPTPTPTPTPTPVPAFRTTIDTRIVYGSIYDPYGGGTFVASSGANVITLPFNSSFGVYNNGTINWGDGTTSSLSYANRVHTYTTPGIYQITITVNSGGEFTGWGNTGTNIKDRLKFLSIDEWGDFNLGYDGSINTFFGFYNLSLSATTDTPKLYEGSVGTGISNLFENTFTGMTTINNIGSWDVREVDQLDYFLANGGVYTSGLQSSNYDDLLNGWASYGASLQSGLTCDFGDSKYSPASVASRNYLTTTKGWTINDGGPV